MVQFQCPSASFSEQEAKHFVTYLAKACLIAKTHALPKYPYNLILDLGLKNRTLRPGADLVTLPKKFSKEACVRINANRKLGVSVMMSICERAPKDVREYGQMTYLVDEAGHFGFGGLYANLLAEQGFISEIRNTAGRGNEVFPYNADYGNRDGARMGTNPITYGFPTSKYLGFNVIGDFALSAISYGGLKRKAQREEALGDRMAVDSSGAFTTDPKKASFLVYEGHRTYSLSLQTEAFAALMGGGLPWFRAISQGDTPGGASNWVVTVSSPEFYSCKDGEPLLRLSKTLELIVKENGRARLPGSSATMWPKTQDIALDEHELECLRQMADQAKVRFQL